MAMVEAWKAQDLVDYPAQVEDHSIRLVYGVHHPALATESWEGLGHSLATMTLGTRIVHVDLRPLLK